MEASNAYYTSIFVHILNKYTIPYQTRDILAEAQTLAKLFAGNNGIPSGLIKGFDRKKHRPNDLVHETAKWLFGEGNYDLKMTRNSGFMNVVVNRKNPNAALVFYKIENPKSSGDNYEIAIENMSNPSFKQFVLNAPFADEPRSTSPSPLDHDTKNGHLIDRTIRSLCARLSVLEDLAQSK